ncbi:hypothetical protein [Nostoc sp.]
MARSFLIVSLWDVTMSDAPPRLTVRVANMEQAPAHCLSAPARKHPKTD